MLLRHALNLKWTNVPVLICTLFVVVGACSGAYALRNCANNSSKYNTKFVCTNCVCARKHCTVDVLFLQSVVGCVCVCKWFTALTPGTMASNLLAHKPTAKPPPSQWIRRPIACNRNDEMMILRCLRLRRTQAGIRAHHHTHKDRRYAENTHAHARASTHKPASTSHKVARRANKHTAHAVDWSAAAAGMYVRNYGTLIGWLTDYMAYHTECMLWTTCLRV